MGASADFPTLDADIGEQVVFLTTGEFQEFSEEGISGRGGDE